MSTEGIAAPGAAVSVAAPKIQDDHGLSSSGIQRTINAYLLTLAALFAFGGRLVDTARHRKMIVLGVIVFAGSSALCGLTPKGVAAKAWIVAFRAAQGVGEAIMFPAALAIVVQTFELRSRGRALALFGIAGGPTAIGPIVGAYLLEWTWRAIFWVNVPVALIALTLIAFSKPVTAYRPLPMGYRGLALIAGGVGLSLFGPQQSPTWSWGDPAIEVCLAVGVMLLVIYIVLAGAGMGLMLGQASTDAVNRACRSSYGEATGLTQTVRNYGASLSFAILGTILLSQFRSAITSSLTAKDLPGPVDSAETDGVAQLRSGNGIVTIIPAFVRTCDTLVPPDSAEFLHQRLPHGKLDIIDAGHFAREDAADQYAALTVG